MSADYDKWLKRPDNRQWLSVALASATMDVDPSDQGDDDLYNWLLVGTNHSAVGPSVTSAKGTIEDWLWAVPSDGEPSIVAIDDDDDYEDDDEDSHSGFSGDFANCELN
jgi:hypothetical protein